MVKDILDCGVTCMVLNSIEWKVELKRLKPDRCDMASMMMIGGKLSRDDFGFRCCFLSFIV